MSEPTRHHKFEESSMGSGTLEVSRPVSPKRRPEVLFVLAAAFALTFAACSDATSDSSDGENQQATQSQEVDSDESGELTAADAAPRLDPDFDYESVDYDADPAGSALYGDRLNSAFPPALVDPRNIAGGGPPPDGITPIDDPDFIDVGQVNYLTQNEAVIAVEFNGVAKAYPVRVLTTTEIVNDDFDGVPVSVFYCPLCSSAIAFERTVGDRVLDFGTSGELFQSALVAYDRQTESLWAHFTGQAIIGHYAGTELKQVAAQTVSFASFVEQYPNGLVLTGAEDRDYNPYGGYEFDEEVLTRRFLAGTVDERLPQKERVLGIEVSESTKTTVQFSELTKSPVLVPEPGVVVFFKSGLASPLDANSVSGGEDIGQTGVFRSTIDAQDLTFESAGDGLFKDNETGSTWNLFGNATAGPLNGSSLEPVAHLDTFWFAWSAYYPESTIVSG